MNEWTKEWRDIKYFLANEPMNYKLNDWDNWDFKNQRKEHFIVVPYLRRLTECKRERLETNPERGNKNWIECVKIGEV